jgi:hypothetical protein
MAQVEADGVNVFAKGAVGQIAQAQRAHPVDALLRQKAHLPVPGTGVGVALHPEAHDEPYFRNLALGHALCFADVDRYNPSHYFISVRR